MKKYTIYSNFGPLTEVSTKKEAEALVKTSRGECWYKLTEPIHKKPLEESKLEETDLKKGEK